MSMQMDICGCLIELFAFIIKKMRVKTKRAFEYVSFCL